MTMDSKMDYKDGSGLAHATPEQRFQAKLIDFVLVSIVVLIFFNFPKTIIEHCFRVMLFYITFYQTILDGLGGTVGKRIVGIFPIDEYKMRPLTLIGSFKRLCISYFMACLVAPILISLWFRLDKDTGYRSWVDYICRVRSVYIIRKP
ncbi:MAG: RDD family protein [Cyclobacteriaceae bacterium]